MLLTYFWWGSVFLIAVPIMVVLLVVGPFLLPEYRDENAGRLDLLSAALSVVAVLITIYGIKHAAAAGFDLKAGIAIAAGLAVAALFAWRQSRLANPLIDLSLFRSPTFSAALGINVLGFFAAFGTFMLTAQYLQLVIGLTPLAAGLWSAPSGLAFIVGSTLAPRLLDRLRPVQVMALGYCVTAGAFLLLAYAAAVTSLPLLVAGYIVMSFGLAPIFTLSTDLIIGAVPPQRAGVASGLAETSSEFGGALGVAILGSIVTALYASGMATIDLAGFSANAATAARETIGGAVAEAQAAGGAAGQKLLDSARVSYGFAVQVVSLVGAGASLLAALVAIAFLGRGGAEPREVDAPDGAACRS